MTKQERIKRDIGLTFDFLRQIVKNPKLLNEIPDGSDLEFVDKDFPTIEKSSIKRTKSKKKYFRVKTELELIK